MTECTVSLGHFLTGIFVASQLLACNVTRSTAGLSSEPRRSGESRSTYERNLDPTWAKEAMRTIENQHLLLGQNGKWLTGVRYWTEPVNPDIIRLTIEEVAVEMGRLADVRSVTTHVAKFNPAYTDSIGVQIQELATISTGIEALERRMRSIIEKMERLRFESVFGFNEVKSDVTDRIELAYASWEKLQAASSVVFGRLANGGNNSPRFEDVTIPYAFKPMSEFSPYGNGSTQREQLATLCRDKWTPFARQLIGEDRLVAFDCGNPVKTPGEGNAFHSAANIVVRMPVGITPVPAGEIVAEWKLYHYRALESYVEACEKHLLLLKQQNAGRFLAASCGSVYSVGEGSRFQFASKSMLWLEPLAN